jgi:hypothetical protein
MKTLLIAVALLAGTFTKSFAASDPAVEPSVLKSFNNTFAHATEVDWSRSEDLYKAVFLLNGQYVTAYFKEDGTMAAISRHISAASLPIILQTGLKNDYNGQWVSDVIEVTTDGGLQYYATLENANSKVVVKATATTWSTYQKQRKD